MTTLGIHRPRLQNGHMHGTQLTVIRRTCRVPRNAARVNTFTRTGLCKPDSHELPPALPCSPHLPTAPRAPCPRAEPSSRSAAAPPPHTHTYIYHIPQQRRPNSCGLHAWCVALLLLLLAYEIEPQAAVG